MRQPTLIWPGRRDADAKKSEEERDEEKVRRESKGSYVRGSKDEDNRRYKDFLEYCEERRKEYRRNQEEETERKKEAGRKTVKWDQDQCLLPEEE